MCMVAHARMDYGQRALEEAAAASCRTQEELQSSACHSEPSLAEETNDRPHQSSAVAGGSIHSLIDSSNGTEFGSAGQKRSRDDEPQSVLSGSSKKMRVAGRRVQFAEESKMKLIPRLSELLAEADAEDAAAAAAAALPDGDSMEEEVEVLLAGVVEDGMVSSIEIPAKDDDEMFVKTKEEDGPSTENVATQALVVGLIERKLSGASAVVDALRSTIRKTEHKTDLEDQPAGVCDDAHHAGDEPDGPPSSPKNCRARSEQEVFELVVSRMQLLIDRIESRGRATLLPSTAQIGPPFVPALKFLQRAIRSCGPRRVSSSPVVASPAMVPV